MDDRKRVAGLVRDWLARQRVSRDAFAHETRLGRSTVDKLLVGLFSDRTLAIVEAHTGLALRELAVAAAPGRPDAPSIAVLPFNDLGGDAQQTAVADGLTEDIITELSRLRWLFVIARNSSFTYRDRAVDVRQVARELGVRYVLEGSVRSAAGRIRVTGQLIDAETGMHLWAERYDRALGDIFAVQDEITRHVVAAIEPRLYAEEASRAARKPPGSLDAWGLVVRAMGLLNRISEPQNAEAQALLHQALAIEPGYARAHAMFAWAKWWEAHCGWRADRAPDYAIAMRHAEEAVARDAAEPWARMALGLSLSNARQHARALAELGAALDLTPNFALGRSMYGWALLRAGRFDEAIEETGRAMRLSPADSFAGIYTSTHGLALLGARRFEEALPHLRGAVAAFGDYTGHYNTLIACCGHLGLTEEAAAFRKCVTGSPRRSAWPRRGRASPGYAHADVFVEGLRLAGVPE